MIEVLIKHPYISGLGTLKLRIHRGSLDWATKDVEIAYELLNGTEGVIVSGNKLIQGLDLSKTLEDLTASLVDALGFTQAES